MVRGLLRLMVVVSMQIFGAFGRLVGRVDAGDVHQLPALRFLVQPLTSCGSASASGASTNTLKNSAGVNSSPAMRRSEQNGEMNDTSTISPASTIRHETSATRWIFLTRSWAVQPLSGSRSECVAKRWRRLWRRDLSESGRRLTTDRLFGISND